MTVHYTDDQVTLHHGDALQICRQLDSGEADCIVTSPPYFGLRDYGTAGQYGLEASPAEYVETMRALFAELRRVLADDGTLWLNIGDSYYSGKGSPTQPDAKNGARVVGVSARLQGAELIRADEARRLAAGRDGFVTDEDYRTTSARVRIENHELQDVD